MVGQRIFCDAAAGQCQRLLGQEKTHKENGVSTATRATCGQITGAVVVELYQ